MVKNIVIAIKLAREPLSGTAIIAFAKSLPRHTEDFERESWKDGACNKTMKKACDYTFGTPEQEKSKELTDYFLLYLLRLPADGRDMLIDSVVGVVSALETICKSNEFTHTLKSDALYDYAASAAASCVNLHNGDDPPCMRFEAFLKVILAVLRVAVMEQRESMLDPSRN
jgi:hypothetical protein